MPQEKKTQFDITKYWLYYLECYFLSDTFTITTFYNILWSQNMLWANRLCFNIKYILMFTAWFCLFFLVVGGKLSKRWHILSLCVFAHWYKIFAIHGYLQKFRYLNYHNTEPNEFLKYNDFCLCFHLDTVRRK